MGPKTLVAAAAVATVLVASAWHNTPVTVFQPSSNNSVSDLIMKNATTYRGSFQGCDAHQMEIIQRHWTGALQLAQEPVLSDKTTPPSNAHTYDDAFFEGLAKYMTTTENLTISCVDVPFRGDQTFCDLHRKTPFSLQSSLIYGATPERLPLLLVCEDKLYTLPTFDDTPTGTSRVGAGADHFLLELVQLYAMSDIFADGGATLNLAKLQLYGIGAKVAFWRHRMARSPDAEGMKMLAQFEQLVSTMARSKDVEGTAWVQQFKELFLATAVSPEFDGPSIMRQYKQTLLAMMPDEDGIICPAY